MKTLAKFDFGNDFVTHDAGYIKIERLYISSRYMWVNELGNHWHDPDQRSPLRDIVFANRGEFRMGLPAGKYCLRLQFFDPCTDWNAFPISFGATDAHAPLFAGSTYQTITVAPEKGKLLEREVELVHTGGPLAVRFPERFFVSGMEVLGEEGSAFERMYPEAPNDCLPSRREVLENGETAPLKALAWACDWFLAHRLEGGFIGDFEGGKRLWYTASYPIRTLFAGYQLLHKQAYFDAAVTLLDLLVSEQMPEGAFTQAYRARKTAGMTEVELEAVRKSNWMNLADVGSMVASLAVACRYVEGERKEIYQAAVRKYLDSWALRYRQENGGFTNGWVHHPAEKVYSVSTAASALTLGLFSQLTGEKQYLRYAEDAALLLAKDWNEDGRNWNFIFDGTYPGQDCYQGANEFGDGFYTTEAISALLALSDRTDVRAKLFEALRRYLFGAKGLLAFLGDGSWWPLQNNWHNSKSAGNPILLLDFLRYGAEFDATEAELARVREVYAVCEKFISTPDYAKQLEIGLDDPQGSYPFAVHSIQSWTGCTAAATGFAGIAFAQIAAPGVIYLKEEG